MKKIYIAGKITGLPQNEVIEKFETAKAKIESLGFHAINPVQVVNDWETTWENAMKKCLKALIDCDAVVILPCWSESKGATIERQLAEDLGMVICNNTDFGLKVLKKNLQ